MRAVIIGAGAIGVWMGERLAAAGWTVSALARGATLSALQTHGLRVIEKDVMRHAPVIASDDPAASVRGRVTSLMTIRRRSRHIQRMYLYAKSKVWPRKKSPSGVPTVSFRKWTLVETHHLII